MKLKLLIISLLISAAGVSQDFLMKRTIADHYYKNFDYFKAQAMYEQLLKSHPGDIQLYEYLADIAGHLNDSRKAEKYYSYLANRTDPKSSDIINYALALSRNGKYDLALTWFSKYANVKSEDSRGTAFAEAYRNISLFYKDSASFSIQKLPFSSHADEFSPAYFGPYLIFPSDRAKVSPIRSTCSWTGSSFLDLYIADHRLKEVRKFSVELNSGYHEGPVSFSQAYDTIYFTGSCLSGSHLERSKEGIGKLSIYLAVWDAVHKKWTGMEPMPFNSREYSAEHPALSPDGKLLYFSSDMPGGFGGMDLYVSKQVTGNNGAKSWGSPVNLGPGVNTPGNELFPFIDTTGSLWFASDGLPGLGGLDIFCAAGSLNGFSKPVNAGYPMNTCFDDFGFITLNGGNDGFMSSNRFNDPWDDDIYSVKKLNR